MDKKYYSLSDYIERYKLSDNIVAGDFESYVKYPLHNFVYNKLDITVTIYTLCTCRYLPIKIFYFS